MSEKKTEEVNLSIFPWRTNYDSDEEFIVACVNWTENFEALQRKELERLRSRDKRSLAVRRALIDYIEKKVLGIKRNTLGEEIVSAA